MGAPSGRSSASQVGLQERRSAPPAYKDGWRGLFESVCFLDTAEFQEYAKRVESVIYAAARLQPADYKGIPTREIHARLGRCARPEWTADALLWLKTTVEPVGILPTRYRPRGTR